MPVALENYSPVREEVKNRESRFYRPELDVLRLFAFLCVFLHHGPRSQVADTSHRFLLLIQESGGFGLSIFFFLSAYLITELLLLEKGRTGSVHLGSFYTRRILRIWPLYIGFVLFAYGLGKVVAPYWISVSTVLGFLLFAGNMVAYPPFNPIGPLWSISVEEQFYLLWPWLARWGGRRTLRWCSCLVFPVAFGAIYYLSVTGHEPNSSIWENSFVEFLFFATGALMALWWGTKSPRVAIPWRLVMLMGGVALWMFAEHFASLKVARVYPAAWKVCAGYGLVDIGCAVIFLALLGFPAEMLPKPAVYLGKISYGLYVFHDLCFEIGKHLLPTRIGWTYVVALALTLAMAILSFHFFEKPFLRLKRRFEYVKTRTE